MSVHIISTWDSRDNDDGTTTRGIYMMSDGFRLRC